MRSSLQLSRSQDWTSLILVLINLNLAVISKPLERQVAPQLVRYLEISNLLSPLQSGFRQCHSTKTVVLRVLSDILEAADR
jgi:hypothetical protein